MVNKIRVAILDDHSLVIEGYKSRLSNSPNIEVVGTAFQGEDLESLLAEKEVDVLLLDVVVPISETNRAPYPILHIIPKLLQIYPNLAVLVVSMHSQQTLIRAVIEAGASGYILKDDQVFLQDLSAIIETVAHGGIFFSQQAHQQLMRRNGPFPQLTSRQLEAVSLCAAYPEATTAELAERMRVANSTVRNLLSGAYMVLEVHSRTAAVAKALQLGLIPHTLPPLNITDLTKPGLSKED